MYFVSQTHADNFYQLLRRYPVGQRDREYQTGFYIVAHPEIFHYCNGNPVSDGDSPFDWYFDESNDSSCKAGLSSGFLALVQAGINLFNNHEDFSLYLSLGTWGDELFKVFVQACEIRRGRQLLSN